MLPLLSLLVAAAVAVAFCMRNLQQKCINQSFIKSINQFMYSSRFFFVVSCLVFVAVAVAVFVFVSLRRILYLFLPFLLQSVFASKRFAVLLIDCH